MARLAVPIVLAFAVCACAEDYVPGSPVQDAKTAIKIGRAACRAKAVAQNIKFYPSNERAEDWKAERSGTVWKVSYTWMTFINVTIDASDGKAGDCDIVYVE
jgi:hypothetical protein